MPLNSVNSIQEIPPNTIFPVQINAPEQNSNALDQSSYISSLEPIQQHKLNSFLAIQQLPQNSVISIQETPANSIFPDQVSRPDQGSIAVDQPSYVSFVKPIQQNSILNSFFPIQQIPQNSVISVQETPINSIFPDHVNKADQSSLALDQSSYASSTQPIQETTVNSFLSVQQMPQNSINSIQETFTDLMLPIQVNTPEPFQENSIAPIQSSYKNLLRPIQDAIVTVTEPIQQMSFNPVETIQMNFLNKFDPESSIDSAQSVPNSLITTLKEIQQDPISSFGTFSQAPEMSNPASVQSSSSFEQDSISSVDPLPQSVSTFNKPTPEMSSAPIQPSTTAVFGQAQETSNPFLSADNKDTVTSRNLKVAIQ
jgi:hypothetical protein